MYIISWPSVNSTWRYSPEMPKLGQNLFRPLWPLPLTSDLDLLHGHHSLVITPKYFMMIQWQEHCEQGIQITTTPLSPLMKWTTSPFMCQQVGNCTSFTLSVWPITWPIYLPCTGAQGQSHCASNIIPNSYPFHSKWVDPPIPEIQHFLTLKIQGQGHSWRPHSRYNTLSAHIPLIRCRLALTFLYTAI